MKNNKTVLVFGTFDILHKGHLNFFKQAKKYGNILIVVIARNATVKKVKGKLPRNNEKKRLELVKNAEIVDQALLGLKGNKYKIIKKIKPDIICLGYDQTAFTDSLEKELINLKIKTKIYKMKPYKEKIYKSSKMKDIPSKTTEFSFILKSSSFGIGVFATHDIKDGSHLRLFGDKDKQKDVSTVRKKRMFQNLFGRIALTGATP